MLKVILVSCLVLRIQCSIKPVQRDNGIWFPGKSCGIKTEIKYLSEMPEDTSNLACTFIHANQPKQKSQKPCKEYDTKYLGTPYFQVENPRPQTSNECQESCQGKVECEFWMFHEQWKWCKLFDSEDAAGEKKLDQLLHTIGPKNCEV